MEVFHNLMQEGERKRIDTDRKHNKSRIISFGRGYQQIYLGYRLTVVNYSESKSDDDDEEKVNAEPKIEMFDTRKITTNTEIGAVRKLVNIELT